MALWSVRRVVVPLVLFLAAGLVAPALAQDIPLRNWAVPGEEGGVHKSVDATSPRAFIGLPPCRLLDTRGAPIGGGIFANSEARNYTFVPFCGIPSIIGSPIALSLNFTVTGSPAAPPGAFILAWPQGGATPTVSILNFQAGQTIANAAIVPTSGAGGITINVSHSTHVIVDVNGYFSNNQGTSSNFLEVINNGQFAIRGETNNQGLNASGVAGLAMSSTGITNGVVGQNFSSSDSSDGVFGVSESTTGATVGVWGRTRSTDHNAIGIYGEAVGAGGATFGVLGRTASTNFSAVGVFGDGPTIGVRGKAGGGVDSLTFATSVGVLGQGYEGVHGTSIDDLGKGVSGRLPANATGHLGYRAGLTYYGVFASIGTIGCNGCVKQFVDPHPTDPRLTIHYVSLEGPEAGTYFRGTARTSHGRSVIEVPDHFRWVTQEEGMTVQLTPVGDLAMMAVVSQDLNRIVVRSSKDVSFHYLVQGIRPAHREFQPVVEGTEYAPQSAQERMPEGWTEWARQRLIENGTYNPDGTVNMETAERAGWAKAWREREEKTRAAVAKSQERAVPQKP